MRNTIVLASLGLALILGAVQVRAQDKPKDTAAAAFERLKKLEGEWTHSDGKGKFIYHVIASGSAVEETMAPGKPHEMVTMYHLDGNDLVLTHYCGAGNQPHMKAKLDDPKKLVFEFDGGSNVDPAKDKHMHSVTITFTDDDHMKSEWSMWEGGAKKGEAMAFDLIRAKK